MLIYSRASTTIIWVCAIISLPFMAVLFVLLETYNYLRAMKKRKLCLLLIGILVLCVIMMTSCTKEMCPTYSQFNNHFKKEFGHSPAK